MWGPLGHDSRYQSPLARSIRVYLMVPSNARGLPTHVLGGAMGIPQAPHGSRGPALFLILLIGGPKQPMSVVADTRGGSPALQ